jgi:hypothetical protein
MVEGHTPADLLPGNASVLHCRALGHLCDDSMIVHGYGSFMLK